MIAFRTLISLREAMGLCVFRTGLAYTSRRIYARQTTQACKPGASKATMSFLFDSGYYEVGKNGVSPFQNMHFHLCPIETRVGERIR